MLDPMEKDLSLNFNTLLKDMETNDTLILDKSKNLINSYKKKLSNLQSELREICIKSGWKYSIFYTNDDITKFLLNLSKTISLNKQQFI